MGYLGRHVSVHFFSLCGGLTGNKCELLVLHVIDGNFDKDEEVLADVRTEQCSSKPTFS